MIRPASIQWINDRTPYSLDFEDIYFSPENGLEESRHVFLNSQNIEKRFSELSLSTHKGKKHFSIFECGFGTGLNFLMTLESFLPYQKDFKLIYTACEAFPLPLMDLKKVWTLFNFNKNLTEDLEALFPPCYEGVHPVSLKNHSCELNLFFMPFQKAVDEFVGKVDAFYLDGFSPQKNPEMWKVNSFKKLKNFSKKDQTTFSTFSSAGWVRRGLEESGFSVEKIKGFQKKREMITGVFRDGEPDRILEPWNAFPAFQNIEEIKIIGGGISGCSLAYEFSQNGCDVEVVEKESTLMNGASGNPYALVMPLSASQDNSVLKSANQSYFYSRNHYAATSLLDECGAYKIPRVGEEDRLDKFFKNIYVDPDFAQHCTRETFIQNTGLTEYLGESIFYPHAGMVQPKKILEYFQSQKNIKWNTESSFREFNPREGYTPTVFAHSNGIKNNPLFSWLPVRSVRGQLVSLKEVPGIASHLKNIIAFEGYLTPSRDGKYLLGATYDREDLDLSIRESENIQMISQLKNRLGIDLISSDTAISQASLRLTTSDHLPILGALPDLEKYCEEYKDYFNKKNKEYREAPYLNNQFILSAMGSRGFTLAPYGARILSALLFHEPLPIQKSLFISLLPQRFILRHLKRLL